MAYEVTAVRELQAQIGETSGARRRLAMEGIVSFRYPSNTNQLGRWRSLDNGNGTSCSDAEMR